MDKDGIEIRILGPVEATCGVTALPLVRRQQRLILGFLALEANHLVSSDRLISLLWGDHPPKNARAVVQSRLSEVRSMFARIRAPGTEDIVVTHGGSYLLDMPLERVDAHRFRSATASWRSCDSDEKARQVLRTALDLWRGPVLGGNLPEHSYTATCHALESARLTAAEDLFDIELRLGNHNATVDQLLELSSANPTRERLMCQTMFALFRTGRGAEALCRYDRWRRWLSDELGVDPGTEIQQLHISILRGDENPLAERTPESAVPSMEGQEPASPLIEETSVDYGRTELRTPSADASLGRTGRCFLPRATRDFAGRSAEVRFLLGETAQDAPPALVVSPIDGMGGVGKTALAVHVAHQMIDRFPDGQYFVDLHGFTEGVAPLAAADALDRLLQEAGVAPELVPSDVDRRSALWRSEMAGKRALVLLDNAVDAAQVRPLLPGTSRAAVIITSRRRLTALEGAVPLSLDVLAHEDAVELFTKIVGADRVAGQRQAVNQVVELCGRLPLAVGIAAARLRDRTSWTVPYLVDQLRNQRRRHQILSVGDRSVLAVLSLSYRYLDKVQQKLLRLLSLHPGDDFDAHAAAAVANLELDEAADALEVLFEDNLLLQHAPGRYQFHDLVRDCSRRLLEQVDSPRERREAEQRLLDYYLQSTHNWCSTMAKGPFRFKPDIGSLPRTLHESGSDLESMGRIKVEYRNLVAVARFAFDHGWDNHGWQLVCSLQPFLRQINYGGDALELFESAGQSARGVKNRRAESLCLTGVALILRERQLNTAAAEVLRQAIEISREEEDAASEAYQLADLGTIKLNDFKVAEAYDHFTMGRLAAEALGDEIALASLENNLGVVCVELGRTEEALRHFDKALAFYRKAGADGSVALTQVNIGVMLCRQGSYADAIVRLSSGLRTSRTHGILRVQGWALAWLCVALRATAKIDRSLAYGRESLAIARNAKIVDVECEALAGIGEAFLARGDLDRAEEVYGHAEEVASKRGLQLPNARVWEGYAHIAAARDDRLRARQCWEEALRVYPAEAADAYHAKRHLTAMENGTSTDCLRCTTQSTSQTLPRVPCGDSHGESHSDVVDAI